MELRAGGAAAPGEASRRQTQVHVPPGTAQGWHPGHSAGTLLPSASRRHRAGSGRRADPAKCELESWRGCTRRRCPCPGAAPHQVDARAGQGGTVPHGTRLSSAQANAGLLGRGRPSPRGSQAPRVGGLTAAAQGPFLPLPVLGLHVQEEMGRAGPPRPRLGPSPAGRTPSLLCDFRVLDSGGTTAPPPGWGRKCGSLLVPEPRAGGGAVGCISAGAPLR